MTATWDEFISENLLKSGLFTGLCLLSNRKEIIYSYGSLKNIDKGEQDQIFSLFSEKKLEENHTCLKLKVVTSNQNSVEINFRIYHRTQTSIYATTEGNKFGITLSKLPHGVLVGLFQKPVIAHKAIALIENFTERLRL